MTSSSPYVFGFVLGLAFLLLLVMFRSIVIPFKAIILNLLSVGAAYGVVVMVFQRWWLHREGQTDPVTMDEAFWAKLPERERQVTRRLAGKFRTEKRQ